MEAVAGIVTFVYLAISGVVGVRLMRLAAATPATRRPAEYWLGAFFLLYSCVGSSMNVAVYAGWADAHLALPDLAGRWLHAGFFWVRGLGLICLLRFIQQTFRSGVAWATWLASALAAVLVGASVLAEVTEGYEVRVLNGAGYWLQFAIRDAVFIWLALESTRYWMLLRRRVWLGLAEPLVTNRFLLVGIWGGALTLLSWADPVARVLYYLETGNTDDWIPEVGAPIMIACTMVATGFLAISCSCVLLTFFPTRSYQQWLEGRVGVD